MSNDRCNKSIHCTVEQCANHCPTASYRALTALLLLARTRGLIQRTVDQQSTASPFSDAADFVMPKGSRICPTPSGFHQTQK